MITPILFYACFHYNDFFRTFLVRNEVFKRKCPPVFPFVRNQPFRSFFTAGIAAGMSN